MASERRWSLTRTTLALLIAASAVAPLACSSPEAPDNSPSDGGPPVGDSGVSDAGSYEDAGNATDAGTEGDGGPHGDAGHPDGGTPDAGSTGDAGSADAGCPAGDVRGPAGDCRSACLVCETSADCRSGQTCQLDSTGCTSCVAQVGGGCASATCTAQTNCCAGQSCQSPNDPPQCGVCLMNPHECGAEMPCDGGLVCNTVPPVGCSSCDPEPPTECLAPCTPGSCSAGMACSSGGACVPVPCGEGYQCPAYEVCQPDGGDVHGCAFVPCASDSQCSVGVCVKELCAPAPGTCEFPVP